MREIRRLYDDELLDYTEIKVLITEKFPDVSVSRQNIEQICKRQIWKTVV